MPTNTISQADRDVIKQVVNKYANSGLFFIDARDPLLERFYQIQLQLANVNQANFPAFSNQWSAAKHLANNTGSLVQAFNSTGTVQPVYSIVGLDSQDGRRYTACALGSLPVPATNVTQTLGLFDAEANTTGTVRYTKDYVNAAHCNITAEGDYNNGIQASENIVSVIYTFAQTINGQTVYGAEIIATQGYPQLIKNISPTNVNAKKEIKICLTREASDCDYRTTNFNDVRIPIEGYINFFGNIDTSGGVVKDGFNSIYLIRERAGGSPITPSGDMNIFHNGKTIVSGSKLSWNLDWLKFNKADFDSGERVYYVFKVGISVAGKRIISFITNAPESIAPGQKLLNTVVLEPMQIVYGCLEKHTLILMADGRQKPICEVQSGEWVLSQDERLLRVEDVITGNESRSIKIRFTGPDNAPAELITSTGHPICTDRGIVMAQELTTTHLLMSVTGPCVISEVLASADPIDVYNLHLSTDDPVADKLHGRSTMYANGVLVGDIQMQYRCEDEYHQRPVNVLEKLPEEWHQDYKNYLAADGR
ncbi:hypothetical protein TUM12370_16240 [Salmonella enterica subsp. enterica serovar Choleraesuis]|nr:hypothetical protein TUM12370_16240 [Salmonella enterica subsp. enterica serovar Choleraesuis]